MSSASPYSQFAQINHCYCHQETDFKHQISSKFEAYNEHKNLLNIIRFRKRFSLGTKCNRFSNNIKLNVLEAITICSKVNVTPVVGII